jgi:hypothetical protein
VGEKEARKRLKENRIKKWRYDVKDADFNHVAEYFQAPKKAEGQILTYSKAHKIDQWIDKYISKLL